MKSESKNYLTRLSIVCLIKKMRTRGSTSDYLRFLRIKAKTTAYRTPMMVNGMAILAI